MRSTRHHVRAAKQPAPAVRRVGSHPMPALRAYAPRPPCRWRRAADHVRDLRKDLLRTSAEELAFNSGGRLPHLRRNRHRAARERGSTGPDESKTINEGAVLPWGSLMGTSPEQVCGEMGVRLTPFSELTPEERDIVFHGPAEKPHPAAGEERRQLRRTRLHLLQRRLHRGERAGEGEGREGPGARGPLPNRGAVPGLRGHAPVGGGARPALCAV